MGFYWEHSYVLERWRRTGNVFYVSVLCIKDVGEHWSLLANFGWTWIIFVMKRKESNTENKVILVNEVLSKSLNVENGELYSCRCFCPFVNSRLVSTCQISPIIAYWFPLASRFVRVGVDFDEASIHYQRCLLLKKLDVSFDLYPIITNKELLTQQASNVYLNRLLKQHFCDCQSLNPSMSVHSSAVSLSFLLFL